MPPALELVEVQARYGDIPALFGVDISVPTSSVTALLGPNGAGKSTTLRVATGILPAWRGSVRLHGEDVTRSGVRALARRGLCMIPEGRGIFPTLTVRENLLIQTHLKGRGTLSAVEDKAYERFPVLGQRRQQIAGTLSGGEQQMLALSRVLTTDPQVILLDEISMGLAPLVIESLFTVVRQLAAEGMTILLVEQMVQDALEIADYVFLLSQGRVRAAGQPQDVRDIIFSSYMGQGSDGPVAPGGPKGSSGRSDHTGPDRSEESWWATPAGTLVHRPSCPVIRLAPEVRPVTEVGALGTCGICMPALSVRA